MIVGDAVQHDATPSAPRHVLFSAVRNEAPFLLEWIAYHKVIGFDRIVIAANPSTDGTDELLQALADAGEIHYLPHVPPDGVAPQHNAARLFNESGLARKGDWTLWLDADEFLVVKVGDGRLEDLTGQIGDRQGMLISWRLFGDNGHKRFPGRFVSEDFCQASRRRFYQNGVIKTLFRYDPATIVPDGSIIHRPAIEPHAGFSLDSFVTSAGKSLEDRRENRDWITGGPERNFHRASANESGHRLAQINHYCVRTPEYFLLKGLRGRGARFESGQASNGRHSANLYRRFNKNQVTDHSILRHDEATGKMIEALRRHPTVADAEQAAATLVARQIADIDPAGFAQLHVEGESSADGAKSRRFGIELTLPADAAEMVSDAYGDADVILEYGSGGSTFLALEAGAEFVMAVESDAVWAQSIEKKLAAQHDPERFRVHHADIGRTIKWGRPANSTGFARYHGYALSVYGMPWFREPDLVLIDGRFRVACFLTVMLKVRRDVTVLFDDYFDRPEYHWVEDFFKPVASAGRMARFEVENRPFPMDHLDQVLAAYVDPR